MHGQLVVWCCARCDGHIFITDVLNDEFIWAHLEDTGCDDPTRVPGSQKPMPIQPKEQ